MFEMPVLFVVAFFVAIAAVSLYVAFKAYKGDKKGAEAIYLKAKILAQDVVTYVDQIAKTNPMTNEQKKEMAADLLIKKVKDFYKVDIPKELALFAIHVALYGVNLVRDAALKKDKDSKK
jgi:hypothetical protein